MEYLSISAFKNPQDVLCGYEITHSEIHLHSTPLGLCDKSLVRIILFETT